MIPVPFTVTGALLLIAFCTSKLQYPESFLLIALHSVLGPFETGTLIFSLVTYLSRGQTESTYTILFVVSLAIIGGLNLFSLIIQTPFLLVDSHFQKWAKRRQKKGEMKFNYCWFYFISFLSLISNYKLKMVLFSGLFNFDCLKCKLQTVQKFKIFNVFAFLGLAPQIIILYCAIVLITSVPSSQDFFMILLDTIIIFALNIILSLIVAKKDDDFFTQEVGGFRMNKVVNIGTEEFQSSNSIGGKFPSMGALDDIVELDQSAYATTKRKNKEGKLGNISDENTVTDSHSNINTEDISETPQNMKQIEIKKEVEEQKVQANILMIDEVYDFQSEPPVEDRSMNHQTLRETIFTVEKGLEKPVQETKETKGISDEYIDPSQSEEFEDEQEQDFNKISKPKEKKIKLGQYLIEEQRKRKYEEKLKNAPKYDKMQKSKDSSISNSEGSKSKSKLLQSLKEKASKYSQQSSSQVQQPIAEVKQIDKPHQGTRMKSEPAVRLKKTTNTNGELEKHQYCNVVNKQIKKVVTNHTSPNKDTQPPNKLAFKKISPEKIHGVMKIGSKKVSLNEDHDQNPISNRIKQSQNNSPIKCSSPKHPLHSARKVGGESESDSENEVRNNNKHNQHLKKRKNKTEGISHLEDTRQMKKMNNSQVEKFPKKEVRDSPKKIESTSEIKIKINTFRNEDEGGIKSEEEEPSKEDKFKQFKRSSPNLNFFPRQIVEPSSQINNSPSQPFAPSKSKRKSKDRIQTEISTNSFIKMFAPSNFKPTHSIRCASSSAEKRKKEYYSKSSLKAEDRRKMNSLQRIYLEKLANFK